MRLINVYTEKLEDFTLKPKPEYAILSHTWDVDEEVTYQDMVSKVNLHKKGWKKVEETCRLAKWHRLEYVWIDTCCIDKTSSSELSEAINSMYAWYAGSRVCYAVLSDLATTNTDDVMKCKWWSRGWTLQELIVPRTLLFFNAAWEYVQCKSQIVSLIENTTKIPAMVLEGINSPGAVSIAARMSWASTRTTTRIEDTAYCLFGIFDISMPLVYGEGMKAFRRLQEEIMKHDNDMSILAGYTSSTAILPPSPKAYGQLGSCLPYYGADADIEITPTNRGLRTSGTIELLPFKVVSGTSTGGCNLYSLPIGTIGSSDKQCCIILRKLSPDSYQRHPHYSNYGIFVESGKSSNTIITTKTTYFGEGDVLFDTYCQRTTALDFKLGTRRMGSDFKILKVGPSRYWDIESGEYLITLELEGSGKAGFVMVESTDLTQTFLVFWRPYWKWKPVVYVSRVEDAQKVIDYSYFHGDSCTYDDLAATFGLKQPKGEMTVDHEGKMLKLQASLKRVDGNEFDLVLEITDPRLRGLAFRSKR